MRASLRTPGRPSNDAPVVNDTRITSPAGTPSSIQLSLEDDDGPGPYTFTLVRGPEHGTLMGDNNDRTYTPNAGFVGTDRFRWKVNDGIADSRVATVSITVASREAPADAGVAADYFPPPESQGGWRRLEDPGEIRRARRAWTRRNSGNSIDGCCDSDRRNFAAVVIRRGHIVLEVERGNSAKTDARRVASVSKAVCATVLAIASELSQQGKTPRKMTFETRRSSSSPGPAAERSAQGEITVRQLFNHTSGLCPEATGAQRGDMGIHSRPHRGPTDGEARVRPRHRLWLLDASPSTTRPWCARRSRASPTMSSRSRRSSSRSGIEHWSFTPFRRRREARAARLASLGMPARELARIGYCMLRGGRWGDRQVDPAVVRGPDRRADSRLSPGRRCGSKINAQVFSHGWELPARLTAKRPAGASPPTRAYKPGSGGQLIAFVPSLDLVITRQTGSSGEWAYDEFLRRACTSSRADGSRRHGAGGAQSGEDVTPPSEPAARPATPKRFDWEVATPESQGMSGRKLDALKESLAARKTAALLIVRNDRIVSSGMPKGQRPSTQHTRPRWPRRSSAASRGRGHRRRPHRPRRPGRQIYPAWKDEPTSRKSPSGSSARTPPGSRTPRRTTCRTTS